MDYLLTFLIAVAVTAGFIGVSSVIGARSERRMFAEFAQLCCPKCDTQFGLSAVNAGKDTSPWEELWGDGADDLIHCSPVCRTVVCQACSTTSEIRFQTQGDFFGPRLSVRDPEALPLSGQLAFMSPQNDS